MVALFRGVKQPARGVAVVVVHDFGREKIRQNVSNAPSVFVVGDTATVVAFPAAIIQHFVGDWATWVGGVVGVVGHFDVHCGLWMVDCGLLMVDSFDVNS